MSWLFSHETLRIMNNFRHSSFFDNRSSDMRIVCVFGEALIDRVQDINAAAGSEPKAIPGGAPGNFAFRYQSRQDKYDLNLVRLVSAVGADEDGGRLLQSLKTKGLFTKFIQILPRKSGYATGTVDVTTQSGKSPTYVINKGAAYDHIELTEDLKALGSRATLFYFGSLIQREELGSRLTLQALLESVNPQTTKFVDINLRNHCHDSSSVRFSFHASTIFKLNEEEVPEVASALGLAPTISCKEFAQTLSSQYRKIILVTLGENGALASYPSPQGARLHYEPGYSLRADQIVDTIGCGDSFAAEFCRHYLMGQLISECLSQANRIGAAVALTEGGMFLVEPRHLEIIDRASRQVDIRFARPLTP